MHKRRQFIKEFLLDEKSIALVVKKRFIIISFPLAGIIGSTLRKK